MTIRCGFCGSDTAPDRCSLCGRDPALPYVQRGQEPPVIDERDRNRRKVAEARAAIEAEGLKPTVDRIAERLDVSPRTVRRMAAP